MRNIIRRPMLTLDVILPRVRGNAEDVEDLVRDLIDICSGEDVTWNVEYDVDRAGYRLRMSSKGAVPA